MNVKRLKVAIIGSGPAGLMAATRLSLDSRFEVDVFEKRKGFGRKLLIAGSSGLNISHELPRNEFAEHYSGFDHPFWVKLLTDYSPEMWIQFIEKELKLETFLGTSNRYFVREMKASGILKGWIELLQSRKVRFHSQHELIDFEATNDGVDLSFNETAEKMRFDHVAFMMGGASWLGDEGLEPNWAKVMKKRGIAMVSFQASNVGYETRWNADFLKEAEGKPLKKVAVTSSKGTKLGELMITSYGLEGTPIYFLGEASTIRIDLKPDLTIEQMQKKCLSVRENLSPIRRVKKTLGLSDVALALLFHHTSVATRSDLGLLLAAIKGFRIELLRPRPLSESISSIGGVALHEVSHSLALVRFKNLFCGGEMLDWDAPTGGFLIQACISQGDRIGRSIIESV
jgi:uncharacterized flavoprotein (TIGR03862 family)